jgi:hypothetical protein
MSRPSSGRLWAYLGIGLGGLVSIAANVAHSFIPPRGSSTTWTPEPGAVVGAVVWPVFLFIAVEILARTVWPSGRIWQLVRWAGLVPVAVVAALVSYRHLSGLLAHYGEEPVVIWLGPLAVDGLMVMATGALLATSKPRTNAQPVPDPVVATRPPTVPDLPPTTTPDTHRPVPLAPVPTPADVARRITPPRPASTPATLAAAIGPDPAPVQRPQPSTPTVPAPALAPSTTDISVSASDAAQPTRPVPPDLLARAAQTARQYQADHGTPITPGQLAVRLKVTSDRAAQALAVLHLDPHHTNRISTVNGRRTGAAR